MWWDVLAVFVLVFLPWPWGGASTIQTLREQLTCNPQTEGTNTLLWRVRRDPPAYFFGTIHVPYTRVWDYIPENTKVAFRESENIFFELDLTNQNTMAALRNCQLLPQGEDLSNVLPENMFQRIKSHLEYVKHMMPQWVAADQKGSSYPDYLFNLIAGNWEKKRPIWVTFVLNSLTEADVKTKSIPVLDLYLAQEAARLNKRTGAVEHVEEQCIPLNGLNFTQELFALNQTLWHQESLRAGTIRQTYTTEDLIWHYNCGDLSSVMFSKDTAQVPSMENTTLSPAEIELANQIDTYFRQEILYKRNRRMAMRVKAILESKPKQSFFFAFGAGHFLGNYTVIDILRKAGLEVESVPIDTHIGSSTSESALDGMEGDNETSDGCSSRRHRKRDRKRKKKKQLRPCEPEIIRPISVPVPALTTKGNIFNELWVPFVESVKASEEEESTMSTTESTQFYAAQNLPSVYVESEGSRLIAHHLRTLYLLGLLHIACFILPRIAR